MNYAWELPYLGEGGLDALCGKNNGVCCILILSPYWGNIYLNYSSSIVFRYVFF